MVTLTVMHTLDGDFEQGARSGRREFRDVEGHAVQAPVSRRHSQAVSDRCPHARRQSVSRGRGGDVGYRNRRVPELSSRRREKDDADRCPARRIDFGLPGPTRISRSGDVHRGASCLGCEHRQRVVRVRCSGRVAPVMGKQRDAVGAGGVDAYFHCVQGQ